MARAMTETRRRLIAVRLHEHPDLAWWQAVFDRLARSRFARGENDRGWSAGIDFMLRPNTALRILEGEFDGPGGAGVNGGDSRGAGARSEAARVFREQDEARENAVSEEERKEAMAKLRGVIGDTS